MFVLALFQRRVAVAQHGTRMPRALVGAAARPEAHPFRLQQVPRGLPLLLVPTQPAPRVAATTANLLTVVSILIALVACVRAANSARRLILLEVRRMTTAKNTRPNSKRWGLLLLLLARTQHPPLRHLAMSSRRLANHALLWLTRTMKTKTSCSRTLHSLTKSSPVISTVYMRRREIGESVCVVNRCR
jgi:hypothetical protein